MKLKELITEGAIPSNATPEDYKVGEKVGLDHDGVTEGYGDITKITGSKITVKFHGWSEKDEEHKDQVIVVDLKSDKDIPRIWKLKNAKK